MCMKYLTLWENNSFIELGENKLCNDAYDYLFGAFESLDDFSAPEGFKGLVEINMKTGEAEIVDPDDIIDTLREMRAE